MRTSSVVVALAMCCWSVVSPQPTQIQPTTKLSVNQMCELLKRTGSPVLRIEEPRLWSINAAKMLAIGELHKQLGALEPYYSDRLCKG